MDFEQEVDEKIKAALVRIAKTPVAVLIWGPAPASGTPIALTRLKLKETLISEGHLARFSEELVDSASPHSLLAQQVAHVEAHDVVFSLPGSPGSVAEIHDFARMPGVSHKIITFINQEWNDGYANQTLMQMRSTLSVDVQPYDPSQLPDCVVNAALEHVRTLQEWFYFSGRRC